MTNPIMGDPISGFVQQLAQILLPNTIGSIGKKMPKISTEPTQDDKKRDMFHAILDESNNSGGGW